MGWHRYEILYPDIAYISGEPMGDILIDRRGFMKSAVGGFVFLASNEKTQEEKPLGKNPKERREIS